MTALKVMDASRIKRNIPRLIAVACILLVGYFLISERESLALIVRLEWMPLGALLGIHAVYSLVQSNQYRLALERCTGRRVSFKAWFEIYIVGRVMNLLVPQSGNVYRSVRLKRDYAIAHTLYVSVYLSYAWMSTCLNLAVATAVMGALSSEFTVETERIATTIILALIAFSCGPIVIYWIVKNLPRTQGRLFWIHERITLMLRTAIDSIKDVTFLLKFFGHGLVLLVLAGVAFYLAFLSIDVGISPFAVIVFYAILQLGSFVQITPGNWGVQELAFGLVAEGLALGMSEGILVSLVVRVTGYLALFGLGFLLRGTQILRRFDERSSEPKSGHR